MAKRKKLEGRREREVDMGTPIAETTGDIDSVLSRRRLIGAGVLTLGGIAAWRSGLLKAFEGETQSDEAHKEEKRHKEVKIVSPYEKWANNIVLPEHTIGGDFNLQEHYGAKIDPVGLDRFKADFLGYVEQLKIAVEKAKGEVEKNEALSQLVNKTIAAFKRQGSIQWPKMDVNSQNSRDYQTIHALNRILVQIGYFAEMHPVFTVQKIDEVKKVTVTGKNMNFPVPLFEVGNEKVFEVFQREEIAGQYFPSEQAIVYRPAIAKNRVKLEIAEYIELCKGLGLQPKLGDEAGKDSLSYMLTHEIGHAALDRILQEKGVGTTDRDNTAVRHRKVIPMENYNYEPYYYGGFNNVNIHELFATGMGLKKSGDAALSYACIALTSAADQGVGKNYMLSTYALVEEIVNSPKVESTLRETLKRSVKQGNAEIGSLVQAAHSLSKSDIYEMGEKMAKLGIRITQR